MNNRIDSLKNLLFSDSVAYNDHHYYLSYPKAVVSIKDFVAVCEFFGGYLVELDTIPEFNFLRSYVAKQADIKYVMTGATKEGHKGEWVNIHSGTVAHDIQWGQGEPMNNLDSSCVWFANFTNWYMHAGRCYFIDYNMVDGFLCEIPE